ncbi:MAG: hypothetical protein LUQ40_00400 [Methanomicrobiales archaeon]|nr:hypothetical protein [Methanomicrobiales archaeon]
MEGRKNFSFGITINLENYENLRLEVSGEVGDLEDTESYIAFLDQVLARLGRRDEATAARIDSYRNRVFPQPGATPVEVLKTATPEELSPQVPVTPVPAVTPPVVPAPVTPVPPAREEPSKAAITPPKEAPPVGEFICEECRVPITKGQHQMSQLFMGKTLCKKCMHAPAHG